MRLLLLGVVAALLAGGCAEGASDATTRVGGLTLLTHAESEDGAYPSALAEGRLVNRDGCLAMRGEGGGPGIFILWAEGFGLREREGRTEVVDPDGNLVSSVGGPITLGGGLLGLSAATDLAQDPIPPPCRDDGVERYFLASPDAWPFARTEEVTVLRHSGTRLSGDQASIEGTLTNVAGCIGIGREGPWLVWPIDYGLAPNDPVQVWDGRQRPVATVGDQVRLGGGIYTMPDPDSMPGGIPDDCRGEGESFWYVGEIEVTS
jgi:hypothetical protein